MVDEDLVDRAKECETTEDFVELVAEERLTEDQIWELKQELLTWAIGNFEPPSEYKGESYFMHPMIKYAIMKEGMELHGFLHATNYDHLNSLFQRYQTALESYLDNEPNEYRCTFVFLSVQDGMMTWLCNHLDESPGNGKYFQLREKRDVLAREYREKVVEGDRVDSPFATSDVISNLESIWEHRNEIMHGGPDAVFDMNIATVSLLLIVVTFEVVFEYRDIEPVEVPREWILP
jgi:hypothetical protein